MHLLDDTFNGGPVLRRKKLTVGARESGGAFTSRLEKICLQLLSETLQSIFTSPRGLQSELNSALPQEGQVSWAPLIAPDELEIDWSRSNAEVDAFIRAAAPYPCAFTGLGRELLVVHRGRPVDMPQHPVIPYGQALVVDQRCLIQCGDGYYELLEITAGRRRMKGRELALLLGGKS